MLLCSIKPLFNTLFYNTVSSNSQTKLASISENQEQQNQPNYSRANSLTGLDQPYQTDSGENSRQHSTTTNGEDVPLSTSLNRIPEAQDDIFGENENIEQDIER